MQGVPDGSARKARGPRRSSSQLALRVLLGLAGAGLIVMGFVSEGPLATLGLVISGVILAVVLVQATRSGWMLSI